MNLFVLIEFFGLEALWGSCFAAKGLQIRTAYVRILT